MYLLIADFLRLVTLLKVLGNPFRRWSKLHWCFLSVKDLYQGIGNLLSVIICLTLKRERPAWKCFHCDLASLIPGAFMLTSDVTQLVCWSDLQWQVEEINKINELLMLGILGILIQMWLAIFRKKIIAFVIRKEMNDTLTTI